MGALLFFNPGNDLALASSQRYYTPPAAAVALARAGEWLPLLLGDKGDLVMTTDDILPEDLEGWRGSGVRCWNGERVSELRPWGWSDWAMQYARNVFGKRGTEWHKGLESSVDIKRVRELSHRRISIAIHNELATGLTPVEARDRETVAAAMGRWERVVGKSPLSGSGRGVFHGSTRSADAFMHRCEGTIARQGSVMIEPELEVICEFAMLFRMSRRENGIDFLGYSLFETSGDAYASNILAPDTLIRRRLEGLQPGVDFESLERRLTEVMRKVIGFPPYDGYFGVDMMVYCRDGRCGINPCVEVNMRTTMGVVAWMATRKLLAPGVIGRFMLTRGIENRAEARWSDGLLAEGSVCLSSAGSDFVFRVDANSMCD